jgi:xanthosine utilization system XapX-like protein
MLAQSWRLVSDALPLLDHFRVGVAYSAVHGHDNGRLLGVAFSVLVPRDVWPSKPLFMPQILGQSVLYSDLSGLPAGLLGEGYISFGVTGVVLLSFAFGVLVGILHSLLSTISAISPVTSWLVVASVGTVIGSLRTGAQGGLMGLQIATAFLPIVLLTGGMAKRRRSGNCGSKVSAYSRDEAGTAVPPGRRDHGISSGWRKDASLS